MPEHVHLLLWPRQTAYRMAAILADIKRPVAQQAIEFLATTAPEFLERLTVKNRSRVYHRFWQAGPGQDRNVEDALTAHQIAHYIHQNPVRRRLVARAEEWPWSSAADWAGKPSRWLKVDRSMPAINEVPSSRPGA